VMRGLWWCAPSICATHQLDFNSILKASILENQLSFHQKFLKIM
jgi:hypothetical protein